MGKYIYSAVLEANSRIDNIFMFQKQRGNPMEDTIVQCSKQLNYSQHNYALNNNEEIPFVSVNAGECFFCATAFSMTFLSHSHISHIIMAM